MIKHVEILGYKYEVDFIEDDTIILVNGQECLGACNPSEQKIQIRNDQHKQQKKECYYHEVLHAIDWIINGKHTLSEEQIDFLARGLATVKFIKEDK